MALRLRGEGVGLPGADAPRATASRPLRRLAMADDPKPTIWGPDLPDWDPKGF